MDCRELENRLEALLDGDLDERQRRRCVRHLEGCPSCRELAEPFAAAAPPPEDLVDAVLARTSGSVCGRAEGLLCGWLDGELTGTERRLVGAHLDSCDSCRALAAAMTRLAAELPLLAELRPDPGFVASVLAATLPVRVRLRRWWAAVWPQWVRRPRFASEAAFVATIVLVLIFATPGSPLGAMPTRALELATTDPTARLEAPLAAIEERFTARVKKPLGTRYARGEAEVRAWAKAAEAHGRVMSEAVVSWLGTSRELLASLLGSADEKDSDSEDAATNPTQEKP
jgi:predicted anti-sigma-YlaC factor YlaD